MNKPTILVFAILVLILVLIGRSFYKKKKAGKSITGCDCCTKDCSFKQ